MRLLRSSLVGGSAPKPPGFFRFFQARISILVSVEGDRLRLSPTIPATEPVARVASQQRSIPSASAWLIINYVVRALYKKPANGHSPLNFVSHVLGSPHFGICSTLMTGRRNSLWEIVNTTLPSSATQSMEAAGPSIPHSRVTATSDTPAISTELTCLRIRKRR